MIKRFIIAVVIIGAFLGGLAWFQLQFKPAMIKGFLSKQQPPPATITAEAARADDWIERLPAIGTLIASQGVDVAPQVAGIVTGLGFESDQDVEKGAKLVQLDISVELADQASAEAILQGGRRLLQAAGGPADQERLVRGFGRHRAGEAQTAAAAALNRIKALIAQKAILAPFAGRLGIRHVELGQYVSAGLSMVTLQAQDPIWVDFPMPEQNIGKLKRDQVIELTVDAYPGQVFKGEISIARCARRAGYPHAAGARHSQQSGAQAAAGHVRERDRPCGRRAPDPSPIPRTALTYSLYGDSVYVVKPPGGRGVPSPAQSAADAVFSVERRFVAPGQVREDRVAIETRTATGEQVVTTGQIKLNQRQRRPDRQQPSACAAGRAAEAIGGAHVVHRHLHPAPRARHAS